MKYNDYELFYMIKEDEDALAYIIKKYEPLYRKLSYDLIKKHPNNGLDYEDLVQQCRFITCYVIDKFNAGNNVLFYSYLLICLKRNLNNYVKRSCNKEIFYYMEYDDYNNLDVFKDNKNSYDYTLDRNFEEIIINFKNTLSFLDSCIFELRYNDFSYKEISEILDIKLKKVDNSLQQSRKKLSKYILF